MRNFLGLIVFSILFTSCTKELTFEKKSFEKKSSLPCKENCPEITIDIPVAKGIPVVADSINKKVMNSIKEIVYFGEKPYQVDNFKALTEAFIGSYEEMKKTYPDETLGWKANITADIEHQSDQIINVKIEHETYTGGAHGYHGYRSLLFNPETGKAIENDQLFKDKKGFMALAEKEFREKYKIDTNKGINSTGLMFEGEKFELPLNIFYTESGLLLYYNSYEVASYADGPKEIVFPYDHIKEYLNYL